MSHSYGCSTASFQQMRACVTRAAKSVLDEQAKVIPAVTAYMPSAYTLRLQTMAASTGASQEETPLQPQANKPQTLKGTPK